MIQQRVKGKKFYLISAGILIGLFAIPILVKSVVILTEYRELLEIQFRVEKILNREHTERLNVSVAQTHLVSIGEDFIFTVGTKSAASAQLQKKLNDIVSQTGGTISVSSVENVSEKSDEHTKFVAVSIRWNVDAPGLASFMESVSAPNQNLVVRNLNIRRFQSSSGLMEVQATISSLLEPKWRTNERVSQ